MIRGPVGFDQKGRHGSVLNSLIKLVFSASIAGGRNARIFQAKKGMLSYITRDIMAGLMDKC